MEETKKSARFCRTDLACEAPRAPHGAKEDEGIRYTEYTRGEIGIARLRIENRAGAERLSREIGTYVTISCGAIQYLDGKASDALALALSIELRRLSEEVTGKPIDRDFRLAVVGLGNADLTADAIGPETVRRLPVTRHLFQSDDPLLRGGGGYCSIAAISPGVLAQTGVETLEFVRGICKSTSPDLLLAIDALAARSCTRLAATIQLSDTGLRPGAGIGNCREAISRESLGLPVIALGVPTVVDSSTLVYDALERAGIGEEEISPALLEVLENGRSFFVSPKEIDAITKRTAEIFATAIGDAFSAEPR